MATESKSSCVMIALVILTFLCLPIIYVGLRIGIAYDYTFHDWLTVLLPDPNEPGDLVRWALGIPIILIPMTLVVMIGWRLVHRYTRTNEDADHGDSAH